MDVLHFLNVGNGDCNIIQHGSGRVTIVDVCKARREEKMNEMEKLSARLDNLISKSEGGNFNQKAHPDNPIAYMQARSISSVFRFVLTHPDMDHMDGILDLFEEFGPPNFWDTDNSCENEDWSGSPYRQEDWEFYKSLRKSDTDPKRLVYHSGESPKDYWHEDGLSILAPTPELVQQANDTDEFNDCSYVLLYRAAGRRVILAGDSHDATWEHILEAHAADVSNIDLLIAPHHGRKSDRDYSFLDTLQPKLTLFGNARSEHLAYDAWNSRELPFITNNQAGSVVVNVATGRVYCTNQAFAEKASGVSVFDPSLQAYFVQGL